MKDKVPHIAIRVFYFGLLSLFAAIPSYIVVGFLVNAITANESLSFSITKTIDYTGIGIVFGILVISFFSSYVLWLLAWRALNWTSGRKDGELLPPLIMKTAVAIFGCLGFGALIYGLYIGEVIKVIGGVFYIVAALTSYKR